MQLLYVSIGALLVSCSLAVTLPGLPVSNVRGIDRAMASVRSRMLQEVTPTQISAEGLEIPLFNPFVTSTWNSQFTPDHLIDQDTTTYVLTQYDVPSLNMATGVGCTGEGAKATLQSVPVQWQPCTALSVCEGYPDAYSGLLSTPAHSFAMASFSQNQTDQYNVASIQLTLPPEELAGPSQCLISGAKLYVGDVNSIEVGRQLQVNTDFSTEAGYTLCATVPTIQEQPGADIYSRATVYTQMFSCSGPIVGNSVVVQLPGTGQVLAISDLRVFGSKM